MHFCRVQSNLSEHICCQLVRLLNVPERVPFCEQQLNAESLPFGTFPFPSSISSTNASAEYKSESGNMTMEMPNGTAAIGQLRNRLFPKNGPLPNNLKEPPEEVPEEHLIFLIGVFMLILMAVVCTLFLMKLARSDSSGSSGVRLNGRCIGANLRPGSDYSLMLWLPNSRSSSSFSSTNGNGAVGGQRTNVRSTIGRSPSLFVLLSSSLRCAPSASVPNSNVAVQRHHRRTERRGHRGKSSVSIVSSGSMNALLPHSLSSGSAGLASLNAMGGMHSSLDNVAPPPSYEELQDFTRAEKNKRFK